MPAILSLYIVRRLLSAVAVTYVILFALIFLIDFVDLLQDMGGSAKATLFDVVLLGLQRAPIIVEEIFPFTVLFAAIAAFVSLSRKMELVVARATGVSVWQILAPALLAAAFLGIAVTALYNPAATWLKERSVTYQAQLFDRSLTKNGTRWIRQRGPDDQSILRAVDSKDRGRTLIGVTGFVFTPDGAFRARVDAPTATLSNGYWELPSARVIREGTPPESHTLFRLPTNLSADQVAETITSPETISFWELPRVIAQWELSGIPTEKFRLRYQDLMARPATYATMVLIAATVSLGFARFGGVSRAILGGVLAGLHALCRR